MDSKEDPIMAGDAKEDTGGIPDEDKSDFAPKEKADTKIKSTADDELSSGRASVLLLISSIVVMVAASFECHHANDCLDERGYAVSVGVISTVAAVALVYVKIETPQIYESTSLLWASFFFAWWAAAVIVLTFISPFEQTGNGYFATWLAWVCSSAMLTRDVSFLQKRINALLNSEDMNLKTIMTILLASLIELIAAGLLCHERDCHNEIAFGVVTGAVSLVLVIPFIIFPALEPISLYVSGFLAVLWITAAAVLTFSYPFTFTGNGFFGTWIATIGSCYWFFQNWQENYGDLPTFPPPQSNQEKPAKQDAPEQAKEDEPEN